jgi:hypothetical protein
MDVQEGSGLSDQPCFWRSSGEARNRTLWPWRATPGWRSGSGAVHPTLPPSSEQLPRGAEPWHRCFGDGRTLDRRPSPKGNVRSLYGKGKNAPSFFSSCCRTPTFKFRGDNPSPIDIAEAVPMA